ncbi:MAG: hypothetical protein HDS11_05845 [Bacteroides sp.]|nr:hypothetical protein [Bacteroides sp.]MBD5378271.1 hypothetical protein [Bacteroides sp.]
MMEIADDNRPVTPIVIVRTLDNCYPGSRAVLDSITEVLNPRLQSDMRPELYGSDTLQRIEINTAMSFYDDFHCKTNYIIPDEALKLRRSDYDDALLTMFSEEEIEREGLFLRPRYQIGPLRKLTGLIYVTIVFEKSFSFQPAREQKRIMSDYFLTAVSRIARRKNKLRYDFNLLIADFGRVLEWWINL